MRTHGHAKHDIKTKTYSVWRSMRNRCERPNNKQYHYYGGRGIKVCERWAAFANFLQDMGEKPQGLTLDRIDNNGPYAPENCRWATPSEQAINRRSTIFITAHGMTKCLSAWSRYFGFSKDALSADMKRRKVSAEEAVMRRLRWPMR